MKSKHGRKRDDGWYEVVDTAIDAKRIRNVEEAEGFRCFFRGPIGAVQIVEVPTDMPEPVRDALGRKLSALGVSVLIVNENIKFYRIRRASPDEEKKLNAAPKEERPSPPPGAPRVHEAPEDPRAGSLAHGDGDRAREPGREARALRDAPTDASEGGTDRGDP